MLDIEFSGLTALHQCDRSFDDALQDAVLFLNGESRGGLGPDVKAPLLHACRGRHEKVGEKERIVFDVIEFEPVQVDDVSGEPLAPSSWRCQSPVNPHTLADCKLYKLSKTGKAP